MRAKRACCNASEARIFAPVGGIASETEYKTVGETEGKAEGMAGQEIEQSRAGQSRGLASLTLYETLASLRSHASEASVL